MKPLLKHFTTFRLGGPCRELVTVCAPDEAIRILPALRSPTVMPLAAEGWCSMHSVVEEADLWDKIRQLKAIGAEGILVVPIEKMIP